MERFKIFYSNGKYTIKNDSVEECEASDLSLTGLAIYVLALYEKLETPVHRNPDSLPPRRGIDFSVEGNEDDVGLAALLALSTGLNVVYAKLDVAEEIVELQKGRLKQIRDLT